MRELFVAWLVLAACGGDRKVPDNTDPDASSTVADARTEPDAKPPGLRFIAIGDAGKGNDGQRKVAAAMKTVCQQQGCDFVVMLGDNIYDSGAESVQDPIWQTHFEQPYANLNIPFYAALGNHDYGGSLLGFELGGLGNQWDRGPIEVAYTAMSQKWKMPSTFYAMKHGPAGFIVLDTNSALWSNTDNGDQVAWLQTAKAEIADSPWKIIVGHHPYLSNGRHGNAGNYDAPELIGVPVPNPLPIQNGQAFKDFMDQHVCNLGHVYLSGHDHIRTWINEPTKLCGTEMIVSGAAASTDDLKDRGNRVHFEDASKLGFTYITVTDTTFRAQFYDDNAMLDYEQTISRP